MEISQYEAGTKDGEDWGSGKLGVTELECKRWVEWERWARRQMAVGVWRYLIFSCSVTLQGCTETIGHWLRNSLQVVAEAALGIAAVEVRGMSGNQAGVPGCRVSSGRCYGGRAALGVLGAMCDSGY